jgi:ribosome-associated protein
MAKTTTVKKRVTTRSRSVKKQPSGSEQLVRAAAEFALEKKATNIVLLDVHEITSMTDYFLILSASSDVQVKAIADNILTRMREVHHVSPWKSEGWEMKQWIIIDYVDFVIHIFLESAREFYALERLWADAPTEHIEDKPVRKTTRKKRSDVS